MSFTSIGLRMSCVSFFNCAFQVLLAAFLQIPLPILFVCCQRKAGNDGEQT